MSRLTRIFCFALSMAVAFTAQSVAWAAPDALEWLRINEQNNEAQIEIGEMSTEPRYVLQRKSDRELSIDIVGVTLPAKGMNISGNSSLLERSLTTTTPQGVRLSLTLKPGVTYRVRARKHSIVIGLSQLDGAAIPVKSATKSVSGPARVQAFNVEDQGNRERLVIDVFGDTDFRVSEQPDRSPRLILSSSKLAMRDGEQKISGRAIESIRYWQEGDRVVVETKSTTGRSGTVLRSGNKILWVFDNSEALSERPRSQLIAKDRDFAAEVAAPEVAGFWSSMPLQIEDGSADKQYSGRRIDLDFKDADIHNILRLIADIGQVNIITSDDVGGKVTIRMRSVPWDQALEVVLHAKSLGMVRQGNLIRVAPMKVLQDEREAEIARKKQQQELAPLETKLVPVSYAGADEMAGRIKDMLSTRGTVSVDTRTNILIIRDIATQIELIEKLVRRLDTQTPQVLVEARIVEASSQYSREVGIQWGGDFTMSALTGNPTGLKFPYNASVAGGVPRGTAPTAGISPFSETVSQPNFAVNLPAAVGPGAGGALGLTLGSVDGNVNLNVRLSAAEASGSVRIISSPRILTLDNQEATISSGTLIPYSQVSAQGVNTAFKEAKLELAVTPHVTSDGAVSMKVNITRDEPDFGRTGASGDPTIVKREAQTNLLVLDGNTAVIGGIYTRNTGRNVDQVPFFGDIPVLGVLFKHRSVRDDRNELLIFLTPRIVNRSEALPM